MRRLTAILVAVTLGAVACSGGASSGGRGAARGGVLRIGVVGLGSLDPARADLPATAEMAELLFTPLVRLDPRTRAPRPALARHWRANVTQTTFTFTLWRGARFHDGTPITAADVKATFDRVAARATLSTLAPLLEPVAGYPQAHDLGSTPGLSGVVARDVRTVVITLRQPFALLPTALSHPGLGIVPAAPTNSLADHPVGSGPFRFGSRDATGVHLVRAHTAPGVPAPHVARVELVKFARTADAQASFDAGKLDVLREGEATTRPTRAHRDATAPYLAVGFYALNLKSLKFVDAHFRQAIVRAVDARALVRKVYGGRAGVATGIVPSGVPGGPSRACRATCDHDAAAAKQLLAQAFPHGGVPGIAVDFDDTPTQQALAGEVVAELAAVGIVGVKRPHPAGSYDSFLANDVPELFRLGWVGDFPSADAFLSPVFVSGAPENVAHVSSPAADAAMKAAEAEKSRSKRAAKFAEAERAVLATFAVAPVVQFETRLALARRVLGLVIDPFGGFDPATVQLAGAG